MPVEKDLNQRAKKPFESLPSTILRTTPSVCGVIRLLVIVDFDLRAFAAGVEAGAGTGIAGGGVIGALAEAADWLWLGVADVWFEATLMILLLLRFEGGVELTGAGAELAVAEAYGGAGGAML